MDWKGLGAILKETGAGVSMMNANPNIRQRGYERAQDIQSRRDLEAQRMQELQDRQSAAAQKIKMTIFQKSLEAYQRPDITEDQRMKIGNDISILSQDLGVDPTALMNLPPTPEADMKVGGSVVRKGPDGKYEAVFTDPTAGQRQQTLSAFERISAIPKEQRTPEQQAYLEKQTYIKPERPNQQTFRQQVKTDADKKWESADMQFQKSRSIPDMMTASHRFIDKRVADGLMSVGEAGRARELLNGTARGLMEFDNQYKKAFEILDKDPEAITAGGAAAKGITDATANVLGVLGTILPVDSGLATSMEEYQQELNEVAGDRSQYHAIIFDLAKMNAMITGLANGRMTNQDIEMSIQEIGGNIRSAGQAKRKLREIRERLKDSLKTRLNLTLENFSGISEQDPVQGTGASGEWKIEELP